MCVQNIRHSEIDQSLIILFFQSNPWIIKSKVKVGDREDSVYEGFGIDVLNELANKLNFRYEIKHVDDGLYGYFDPRRNAWVGMIGELVDAVSI